MPLTKIALKLTPHVFVRPGELRRAEWPEFDLKNRIWTIPATKMKMREPHLVPLSKQSIALLEEAEALDGDQRFVFSSLYPGNRPMSENTRTEMHLGGPPPKFVRACAENPPSNPINEDEFRCRDKCSLSCSLACLKRLRATAATATTPPSLN